MIIISQDNGDSSGAVWLSGLGSTQFRSCQVSYVFVYNLLEKSDRKKGHTDLSHKIGDGGRFTFAIT